ncbi:hypothetical protein CSPX01_16680 [Colletotrichum filicis]|nr:hypothetical protein CSPX01_16680 [Colletotrichum filicis]
MVANRSKKVVVMDEDYRVLSHDDFVGLEMEERSLRQSLQSQGASISPAPTSTNDWVVIGIALVSGNFNCLLPPLACAAGATNKTCPSHAVGVGTSVAERRPRQATDGYSTLKGTAIDFHENVVQFNQDVASSETSFKVTDSDASWTLPRFLRFVMGLIKLAGEVDRRVQPIYTSVHGPFALSSILCRYEMVVVVSLSGPAILKRSMRCPKTGKMTQIDQMSPMKDCLGSTWGRMESGTRGAQMNQEAL